MSRKPKAAVDFIGNGELPSERWKPADSRSKGQPGGRLPKPSVKWCEGEKSSSEK